MPEYATREELKVLQDEVEGEKLVTRHLLKQTRLNSRDLATLIQDVKGLKSDVKDLKSKVGDLQSKVGSLDAKLTGLIHNLPAMIVESVREALGQRIRKAEN